MSNFERDILGWLRMFPTDGMNAWAIAFKRGEEEIPAAVRAIQRKLRKFEALKWVKKHRHCGGNRYSYTITAKGDRAKMELP